MAVDLSTLALELSTVGLARGEKDAAAILSRLDARIDRFIRKTRQLSDAINKALSVRGSGSTAGLNKLEADFQKHAARLEAISRQSAGRIAEIEARKLAQIDVLRARSAQKETDRLQRLARQNSGGVGSRILRNSSLIRESGESLQNAGSAATAGSAVLLDIGRTAIEASGRVESITRAFKQLDQSAADQTLARLRQQADLLKTSFTAYADQVNRVRSVQKLTATESENLVQGLVNIGRTAGVTREAQDRATTGLIQVLSKNKIQAEELRGQVFEAIPALAPIVEKKFGTLNAETLEKNFGAKKFVTGLIEELAKLEKVQPTGLERFQVGLENLATKFAPLGDRILDLLNRNLEPLIKRVGDAVDWFSRLDRSTQELIIGLGAVAIATGPVIFAFGSLVQTVGAVSGLTKTVLDLANASRVAGAAAGGLSSSATGLSSVLAFGLSPAVLAVSGALIAGAVVWYEYERQVKKSTDAIDAAARNARRAAGDIEYLNSREVKIPTTKGGTVTATQLDGADARVNLTPQSNFAKSLSLVGDKVTSVPATTGATGAPDLKLAGARARLETATGDYAAAERTLKDALAGTTAGSIEAIRIETQLAQLRNRGKRGGVGAGAKDITELVQLGKQLKEIQKDISSFSDVTAPEFGLRIQLEDGRRFKSELERIITLRRELGEPLRAPLPVDKRGAEAAIERLTALKDLRDAESKFDTRGPFIQAQEASIAATVEQTAQLDRLVSDALPKAETATTAAALAQNEYFLALAKTNPALAEQYRQQATATDAAIKAAEATKTLKSIQDALTGDLDQFQNLTREQTTALELQRAGITDLTSAEVQRTLGLARQIDSQDALQRAYEESQRVTEQFASTTKDAFTTLFTDGPRAFADRTLDTFKRLFADIAAQVATSGVLRLLGIGGGKTGLGVGASGGGNSGGGFNPLSLLTGGGQSGGGSFLTPGFAGGNPAQQILSGGGQGSPASSLLSKLPGIGKFFGASAPQFAAGGKIGANIGSLPGIGQFNIPGLGTPPISASGLPGAAAPGALAGLGATGLLAGGFLGGSLLGGDSTAGKLIGGAGGALALGALGGSGLLGGGLTAALPALFSNPATAIIGGGLLATALAFRLFGQRDFKNFQKAVDTTYQVRVEGDKQGKGLFEQIKSIGEASFGKGQFKKKIPETIRLTPAKDLIAAYGEATDQTQSALVKRATTTREIGSEGNAANRFVRRALGGLIPLPRFAGGFVNLPDTGGDSVATALRGQEYVTRPEVTRAMGVRRFDALNAGQASIVTHDQRGARDLAALLDSGKLPLFSRRMRQGLAAQLQFSGTGAPSETFLRRATGGFVGDALPYSAPVQMPTYAPTIPQQPAAQSTNPISSAELTGLRVMMAAVAETVSNLDAHLNAVPAGHVFVAGMRGNESALADGLSHGLAQNTTATQAAQRILGVQQ